MPILIHFQSLKLTPRFEDKPSSFSPPFFVTFMFSFFWYAKGELFCNFFWVQNTLEKKISTEGEKGMK